MHDFWLISAFVTEFTGLSLAIAALFYRTREHPEMPSLNPRTWIPLWKMRSWFTPKGYKLHLTGWSLFIFAAVFHVLFYVSR